MSREKISKMRALGVKALAPEGLESGSINRYLRNLTLDKILITNLKPSYIVTKLRLLNGLAIFMNIVFYTSICFAI